MAPSKLPAGKKHKLVQLSLQLQEFNEFLPLDESKRDQHRRPMGLEEGRLSTEHGPQLSHRAPVTDRWAYVFIRRAGKRPTVDVIEVHVTKDGKYQVVDLEKHGKKDARPPGTKELDAFEVRLDPANDKLFACLSAIQLTSARLEAYRAEKAAEDFGTILERRCAEFRFDPPTDPFTPPQWKHVVDGSRDGVKALVLADPLAFAAKAHAIYQKNLDAYHRKLQDPDGNARRLLGRLAESFLTPHNRSELRNDGYEVENWNRDEEWRMERLRSDADFYGRQLGVWIGSGPYVQAREDHVAAGQDQADRFLQALAAHQKDLYLTEGGLEFFARQSKEPTYFKRLLEGTPEEMAAQWRRVKNLDSVLKATAEVMKGYWLGVLREQGSDEVLRRFSPSLHAMFGKDAYLRFLDPNHARWVDKNVDEAVKAGFKEHQARVIGTEELRKKAYAAETWFKHSLLVLEVINLGLLVAALGDQPKGAFDKALYYTELAKALSKTASSAAHLFAASSSTAKAMKFAGKVAAIISVIGYGLKLGKAIYKGDDAHIVAYSIATLGATLALAALVFEVPVVGWIGAVLIVVGDLMIMLLQDKPIDVWLRRCEWGKKPKGTIAEQFRALLEIIGKPSALVVDLRDAGGKRTSSRSAARHLGITIDPAFYLHGETSFTLALELSGMQTFTRWTKQVSVTGPDKEWKVESDDRRAVKRLTKLVTLDGLFEVDWASNRVPGQVLVDGKLTVEFTHNRSAQERPVEFGLDETYLTMHGFASPAELL